MRKLFSIVLFSFSLVLSIPAYSVSGELYKLSATPLSFNKSERIVGYELKISCGGIHSINHVPIGWDIHIDNDPSWNTRMKGSIKVGAAALYKDSFNDFLVIEKGPNKDDVLKVQMEIITTTDFVKEKRYLLKTNELMLHKITQ